MDHFDPTAGLTDFDKVPGLRDAWSRNVNDLFDAMIYGPVQGGASALQELQKWGFSDADIRFYNPLSMPVPSGSTDANVTWRALPTSFDDLIPSIDERMKYLDSQHIAKTIRTRVQDEYCEWVAFRNTSDKITKVVFTSEPAAYYEFLVDDPYKIGKTATRALLLDLYKEISGESGIKIQDLLAPDDTLDSYNQWNAKYCVHMQQVNNTLGAEVNIAARSSLLRKDLASGALKTDADDLIQCGAYGERTRQSDPAIGAAVNQAVRDNRFITLQNPVGLYMTGLDTTGFKTPDGAPAQDFWKVTRGKADANASLAMIVRAEFAVPPEKGYTVSDITIGGDAIQYGAQIAAFVGMRLGVLVSPPATLPLPRAIGCWKEHPAAPVALRSLLKGAVRS